MDSQRFSARLIHIAAVLLVLLSSSAFAQREECTSAVLSPVATESGAPVLWKNRDTNTLSNTGSYSWPSSPSPIWPWSTEMILRAAVPSRV